MASTRKLNGCQPRLIEAVPRSKRAVATAGARLGRTSQPASRLPRKYQMQSRTDKSSPTGAVAAASINTIGIACKTAGPDEKRKQRQREKRRFIDSPKPAYTPACKAVGKLDLHDNPSVNQGIGDQNIRG